MFSHGFLLIGMLVLADLQYLYQLCTDTACNLEDLQGAVDDRDEWWQSVKDLSIALRLDNNYNDDD